MYCGNCGKIIDDEATFCGECGAKVETQKNETNQYLYEQNLHQIEGKNIQQLRSEQTTTEKIHNKGDILILIIIVLLCLCIVTTGIIVFLLLRNDSETEIGLYNDENTSIGDITNQGHSNGAVALTVDSYPKETVINPLILTGTMFSRENTAILSINGERVNSVSIIDGRVFWEEEVRLIDGSNIITISLTDSSGNTDEEVVTINYKEAWPFPYGTELTRTRNEANYMIYVRPGPSKQSGDPILKIMPGDFTTTLIYLGEYQLENSLTDGVHNWYNVELPDGRKGWIRDDLAAIK